MNVMFLEIEERMEILRHLQELQADFQELTEQELEECRECMLERVNVCLQLLKECDEDNI